MSPVSHFEKEVKLCGLMEIRFDLGWVGKEGV
jgi:hypothetical protein